MGGSLFICCTNSSRGSGTRRYSSLSKSNEEEPFCLVRRDQRTGYLLKEYPRIHTDAAQGIRKLVAGDGRVIVIVRGGASDGALWRAGRKVVLCEGSWGQIVEGAS